MLKQWEYAWHDKHDKHTERKINMLRQATSVKSMCQDLK